MPMRQVASCMNKGLNDHGDGYQQSGEKEHRMDRDAEADCESQQQSRRCWFNDCKQHLFHNASFSRSKHRFDATFGDNRGLALTAQKLRERITAVNRWLRFFAIRSGPEPLNTSGKAWGLTVDSCERAF
jgi:hypothetical protein